MWQLMSFFLVGHDGVAEQVIPNQAFQIGKSIVGCGDVWGIKISHLEGLKSYVGFVNSKKTATHWYKVTCKVMSDGSVSEPSCICLAAPNMRNHSCCCKHMAALLLSLHALENFHHLTDFPKIFARPNMQCFATASPFLQEKVEYHLTWSEILA